MLDGYRPISLLAACWPTREFEFGGDLEALGKRLRDQFPFFSEQRMLQVAGEGSPPVGPEVPRLVFLTHPQDWILELAPGKVTLRRTDPKCPNTEELFEPFRGRITAIQSWLAENFNLRMYRLGTVAQFFCNLRSSANQRIAEYFLQPRALQGREPHEINLAILSKLTLEGGWMVNRWLRVTPLRTIDPRHVDFALRVEIDINTLPDNTMVKTGRDFAQFLDAVRHHVEQEVPLFQDTEFME